LSAIQPFSIVPAASFRSLLVGIGFCLASTTMARADAAPFILRWDAPPECPSGSQIEAEVLHLVAAKRELASRLRVDAKTAREADGRYHLNLQTNLDGIAGERSLSGLSCRAVSDAAVVTMALSLDPNLEIPQVTASERDVSTGVPPREGVSALPSSTTVAARLTGPTQHTRFVVSKSPDIRGVISTFVGWRWGALPQSTGELGVGFGLSRSSGSIGVEFAMAPLATTAQSQKDPDAGGTFRMQTVGLAGCWALAGGKITVAPCAGLGWTHVRAEGFGVQPIRTASLYWISPMVGLRVGFPLGRRVGLVLGVDGYAALSQPNAYLVGLDTVFEPGRLACQVRAGATYGIW
jgi:hypothetical protein